MKRRRSSGVVVITGASSGIGQAAAEAFARRGARLFLAARDLAALERVAARCRTIGARTAEAVAADVGDAADVRALAQRAVSAAGRIDVWVSNVGVGALGRFHETPLEAHHQIIRSNLIGHMNDAYAVLPIFLRQDEGVFVNMISLGGFAAAPFAAAYSASKFGLRGLSEAIRGEIADRPRIHVCDVYPGMVDTPAVRHSGNYFAKTVSAPPPALNPRRVARVIVRLADRPRPTTMVGGVAWLVRLGHAVAPTLSARIGARAMHAAIRRARPAPVSDGNLYAPPAEAGGVDGGFRRRRSPGVGAALGIAALGAAVAFAASRRAWR